MDKNQTKFNGSQRPQMGSTHKQPLPQQKQRHGSHPEGSSCSSKVKPTRPIETGQAKPGEFRSQSLSHPIDQESRNKAQAPSNEDWEGGASRPAQEAQVPGVKKNLPPPEVPERETPDHRTIPARAAGAEQNRSKTEK